MPVELDIDHLARLARLALTAEEKDRFRRQLGLILEHAEKVGEVAADDVPSTSHPLPRSNVFRADEIEPSLPHDEALAGAPDPVEGRFRVPRILEEEA